MAMSPCCLTAEAEPPMAQWLSWRLGAAVLRVHSHDPLAEDSVSNTSRVISCFDRVVLTGTLPDIGHAETMARDLRQQHTRRFDSPAGLNCVVILFVSMPKTWRQNPAWRLNLFTVATPFLKKKTDLGDANLPLGSPVG